MRTRTLLLTAATLVAGLATSFGQSVYSQNIVGYATLTLQPGFNLIANQFDLDGNGTNNTVNSAFSTNLPPNSQVYTFNGSSFDIATFSARSSSWDLPNLKVNPGMGFWVNNPNGSAVTVTLSGQVLTGTLSNPNVPSGGGFALVSSMIPQAGLLQTDLAYTPVGNDQVYTYNGTGYDISTFSARSSSWDTQPSLSVGQGFWLSTTGNSWSRSFNP